MKNSQNINEQISYQKASVVSKEMVNKPSGTITLFAFDRRQGLSEHKAPFDALVIITDGTAEIVLAGIKHIVKAGEMLLMPANATHALKAIEPFKMILTMIKS